MGGEHVKPEYPLSHVTARVIAAAREVHRELGPGFEEVIYQRALAREFPAHELEYSREVWIDVHYKGEKVGRKRVDFIAGKAGEADGVIVGLLLNFGASKLHIKRLVN